MNTENSKQENENEEVDLDLTDEELILEFINESNEGLHHLEVDFVTLEKEPQNTEILNNTFRVIHSMKGAAGFLGFKNLESVSHKAEDVLNKLRKSKLNLNTDIMDALLSAVDTIKQILDEIEQNKEDASINTEEIRNRLDDIATGKQNVKGAREKEDAQISDNHIIQDTAESLQKKTLEDLTSTVDAQLALTPEQQTLKSGDMTLNTMQPKAKTQIKKEERRSIRIDVDKLDFLFNLVGELVLCRNRNTQLFRLLSKRYQAEDIINQDLAEAQNQLDNLTSELQWAVMKTRMMPISTVFNKYRRMVRDMGKTLGKEIALRITGDNTEIDKNVIEGIGDPLTHIIRNSADHGIEMTEERIKAGKSGEGCIDLNAYYEGNYVVIEIKDNGRGIDAEAVKRKAIEKGMITQVSADSMPMATLFDLILEPGFSTAKKVSAVSGRGVGMDVVKTKIEGLRGQIIIDSEVGVGTDIKLKIPLTLAILDTLIVNVGDHRYAVPLSNIVETHRIKYGRIEKLRGSMVFRMRNELMPVATLSEIIKLPFKYDNHSNVTMLVLRNGLLKMGVVVDKTAEQEEVVIKSIDCLDGIAEPGGVSGATILGDGSITFILDVNALMNLANAASLQAEANVNAEEDTSSQSENLINVVLVENLGKEQYAIPSRNIKEIEIIHKKDTEEVGGKLVIKYRGRIISLTDIPSITKVAGDKEFKKYYMIILADEENEVGLLVGRLLGIKNIDEKSLRKDDIKLNGVIGSTIFEERITLLLDPDEIRTTALNQQSLAESMLAVHSTES